MSVSTLTMIYLLNINEVRNPTSGLTIKSILNKRKFMAEVTNVGTQTQIYGTAVGTTFSYQVELRENMYHDEKYIAFKKKGMLSIYEVVNSVKGRTPEFRKLNIIKSSEEISGVIIDVT